MKDKTLLLFFARRMVEDGLVRANWGNLSIRTSQGMLITPSGMDYMDMGEQDLVHMDLEGNVIQGHRKPSSESPMHLEMYRSLPEFCAVVHTHSIYASAFAVVRQPIPPIIEDMVQIVGGEIRVAEYALPGTAQLAQNAKKALTERRACLLASHGVLGIGCTLEEAYKVCLLVEKSAHIALLSKQLGEPFLLSQEDIDCMRQYYLHQYGQR